MRDDLPAVRRVAVADEATAEAWMRAELARPMDLGAGDVVRAVLLSLPRGRTWWFHAAHHVVLDGYGAQQLLRRVCELYDGAAPCWCRERAASASAGPTCSPLRSAGTSPGWPGRRRRASACR